MNLSIQNSLSDVKYNQILIGFKVSPDQKPVIRWNLIGLKLHRLEDVYSLVNLVESDFQKFVQAVHVSWRWYFNGVEQNKIDLV